MPHCTVCKGAPPLTFLRGQYFCNNCLRDVAAGIEKIAVDKKAQGLPQGTLFSEKPTEIDYHGYRIFSFTEGKVAWSVMRLKPTEQFIGTYIGVPLESVKKIIDDAKP